MANHTKRIPRKVVAMYEGGMSLPQIARATGIDDTTLRRRLVYWKVQMRQRGGAKNGRLGMIKRIHRRMLAKAGAA